MASFRLAIFGMLFSSLGAVIIFGLIYAATFQAAQDEFSPIVASARADLLNDAATDHLPLTAEIASAIQQSHHTYFALTDPTGMEIAGNIPMPPDTLAWQALTTWDDYDLPPGVLELEGIGHQMKDGSILFVAEDASAFIRLNRHIAYLFIGIFGFTILIGLLAATLVAYYSLARVEAIRQASRTIMAGDLSGRIKLYGIDDELDYLTVELNEMIAKIQTLVENAQQVTSDIAHDLRSPLAKLADHLQVSRRVVRNNYPGDERLDELFTDTARRVDGIVSIFDAVLRIAEIEAGAVRGMFSTCDVSKLCRSLSESYESVAEDFGHILQWNIEDGLKISGDQALMTQMIVNVLENAIRHCPAGTRLRLQAFRTQGAIVVEMGDSGPGIPEAERERVFRRFVRLDAVRHQQGNGLGLSMVRAVAHLHEGKVVLRDNNPGLVVQIFLPLDIRPIEAKLPDPIAKAPEYNAHLVGPESFGHHRIMQRFPPKRWPRH